MAKRTPDVLQVTKRGGTPDRRVVGFRTDARPPVAGGDLSGFGSITVTVMADSIGSVLEYVLAEDIGGVVGVYVYGSSTTTGLHHASDVDLLLLTRRTLSRQESDSFASVLLGLSGWSAHAVRFPHAANRRPLEVTSLVVDDLAPLVVEPWRDFQFGEWLRDDLVHGVAPRRERDPDVVILLATALSSHQVLHGPPLNDIVADVPFERLRAAQIAALPALLDDLTVMSATSSSRSHAPLSRWKRVESSQSPRRQKLRLGEWGLRARSSCGWRPASTGA